MGRKQEKDSDLDGKRKERKEKRSMIRVRRVRKGRKGTEGAMELGREEDLERKMI